VPIRGAVPFATVAGRCGASIGCLPPALGTLVEIVGDDGGAETVLHETLKEVARLTTEAATL
jgi:hypothetical protein